MDMQETLGVAVAFVLVAHVTCEERKKGTGTLIG
jgi:hypothetical protein